MYTRLLRVNVIPVAQLCFFPPPPKRRRLPPNLNALLLIINYNRPDVMNSVNDNSCVRVINLLK